MIIGISGSRSLNCEIPDGIIIERDISMILTGGASGMDKKAAEYGAKRRILVTELKPEYDLYGKAAPLVRNDLLIELSNIIYVFWDGKSRGSKYVIDKCREHKKLCKVYLYENGEFVRQYCST